MHWQLISASCLCFCFTTEEESPCSDRKLIVSLITTGTGSPSGLLCLSLKHTHTHISDHFIRNTTLTLGPSWIQMLRLHILLPVSCVEKQVYRCVPNKVLGESNRHTQLWLLTEWEELQTPGWGEGGCEEETGGAGWLVSETPSACCRTWQRPGEIISCSGRCVVMLRCWWPLGECVRTNLLLLFDPRRDEQLLTLHHVLQLTQVAHIVDLPAKLKTTERERDQKHLQMIWDGWVYTRSMRLQVFTGDSTPVTWLLMMTCSSVQVWAGRAADRKSTCSWVKWQKAVRVHYFSFVLWNAGGRDGHRLSLRFNDQLIDHRRLQVRFWLTHLIWSWQLDLHNVWHEIWQEKLISCCQTTLSYSYTTPDNSDFFY